ncbi:MAG: hypothetical protein ED859_08025 [Desulfuromonadales bacterium]|nr:MAG: hypothetical protein ED859_08025 [Desulfuromonadales bacterium]
MACRSMKRMVYVAFSMALMVISLTAVTFAAPVPTAVALTPLTKGIRSPLRVVVDSLGNCYVTDALAVGILVYDATGQMTKFIKTATPPQGIAVTAGGTLLVGQGSYVSMLDAAGNESKRLGSGAGQFKSAGGITVDDDGTIYVVDSIDNCVQVFNAAGGYVKRFGSFGATVGKFSTPSGIAFEKVAKQIAVVDTRNGRVQFFDKNGTYVRSIGTYGANPLRFIAPHGVTFEYTNDAAPVLKRMYVVDTFQSMVQAIDPAPAPVFLSYIGSYGVGSGKLMVPSDVAFDQAGGRLLVVNGYGDLTVFGIDGGGTRVDTTPPALTIDPVMTPFAVPSIDITGTVEAGASVSVKASGSVALGAVSFPTASSWRVTASGFTPGDTTFTVTARDAAQNVATMMTTVTFMNAAPMLTLDPVAALTGDPSQLLSGTVESGAVVTVTNATTGVSGKALAFGSSWSYRIPLVVGENRISVKAEKPQSGASTATATVILDNAPPVLFVSALADGSYTSERIQNIQVSVADAHLDAVTLNGQPVTLVNGGFSTALTLNQGANVIMVAASDLVGNVATDIRTIIFDAERPEIAVATPAEGSYVGTDHVTLSGSLNKAATVTVAGLPALMNGLSWSAAVPLVPGMNTVEIVAVDLAGNVATVKRTVIYDAAAPVLVINSPASDMAVSRDTFGLAGNVTDPSPMTYAALVNGVPVPLTVANGSFSLSTTFEAEGTYTVTVMATDAALNTSVVSRTVIYDATPPALTLDTVNTPVPSALTGTVEAGATVTVEDKNGRAGTVAQTGLAWSATLSIGEYDPDTLAVRATDAAGNSTVKSLVVQAPDGDLDGDGTVSIRDAIMALKISTVEVIPTAATLARGDIGPLVMGRPHPNGVIDFVDTILILRKALGLESW